MKYTVTKEIDMMQESYILLTNIVNDEVPKKILGEAKDKYNIPQDVIDTHFEVIIQLYHQAEKKIEGISSDIVYFFKALKNNDLTIADLLKDDYQHMPFDEYYQLFKSKSAKEKFKYIRNIFISILIDDRRVEDTEFEEIEDEKQLFQKIHQTQSISLETKAMMSYVYYNFESLLDQLIDILQQTSELIREDILSIQKTLDTRYLEIEEEVRTRRNVIFQIMPIEEDAVLDVRLSIAGFNGTRLDSLKDRYYKLTIGKDVKILEELKKQYKHKKRDLVAIFKILADERKFKIIQLLKEEKLYASQLAVKLGISNPTVSHHMNSLMNADLVKIERDKNRYYYELNKEVLEEYMIAIQEAFE